MGRDKAQLPVGGVPMALRVVRALEAAGSGAVVCVGGDVSRLAVLGLDVLADEHPGGGPLAGIVTGLAWSREPTTIVTPCDLITPEPDSFVRLVSELTTSDADVAVPIVDGRWRSLPAAWRTSCLPEVVAAFAAGERSVHRVVESLPYVAVAAGPLADADTPEELEGHG